MRSLSVPYFSPTSKMPPVISPTLKSFEESIINHTVCKESGTIPSTHGESGLFSMLEFQSMSVNNFWNCVC